jgi:hypothetical protein
MLKGAVQGVAAKRSHLRAAAEADGIADLDVGVRPAPTFLRIRRRCERRCSSSIHGLEYRSAHDLAGRLGGSSETAQH